MANYVGVLRKETRMYLSAIYDDIKNRRDPHFFWPNGTQVYCGVQGSGKTISAVKHVIDLKKRYPKSIVVSNLDLKYLKSIALPEYLQNGIDTKKEYVKFSSMDELSNCLTKINNDFFGVIYLIDEIHTYFNAVDSMNIPLFVFTEISQQRKQRKVIIGTSQLFMRMAKPFREQCDNLIICTTFFGVITFLRAYDGMSLTQGYDGSLSGHRRRIGWYVHNRKLRGAFDTYQKVVSGAEQYEQISRMELVGKRNKKIVVS
jgi:hypothetical protein